MSKIYTDPTTGDLTDDPSRGGIEVTIPAGYEPQRDRLVLADGAEDLPVSERLIIDPVHRAKAAIEAEADAKEASEKRQARKATLQSLRGKSGRSKEERDAVDELIAEVDGVYTHSDGSEWACKVLDAGSVIVDQAHRMSQQVAADVAAELALAQVRAERAVLQRLKADRTKPAEYTAAVTARDDDLKAKEDAEVAKGRGKQ